MFKGYCILKNSDTMPPVQLDNAEQVISWAKLQRILFHEVRVTDENDFICFQVIDRKLVYPSVDEGVTEDFINWFNS